MLVASNTSPISNLAIIGRLHRLQTQFGEIWIPGAIKREPDQLSHADASKDVQQAFREGRIKPLALRDNTMARLLEATLDRVKLRP